MGRPAAVVSAVFAPALVGRGYDSFPLSTYPMFAGDRDVVAPVSTVVAIDGDRSIRLSPQLIGGTDEPMLAAETVVQAIRDGEAHALCAEVAHRLEHTAVRGRLEVVTEHYDTLQWFEDDRTPTARTVYAECEVPQ